MSTPPLSYDQVLEDFARDVGLDAAELALTQEVVIDGFAVGLQNDGDPLQGDLVFATACGTPDAGQFAGLARTMLQANYFWVGTGGCTLGVHPDSGAVTLCGRIAIDGLTGPGLAALLDTFVEVAVFWRDLIAGAPVPDGGYQRPMDPFAMLA